MPVGHRTNRWDARELEARGGSRRRVRRPDRARAPRRGGGSSPKGARGQRFSPVLVCSSCSRVTGWVAATGGATPAFATRSSRPRTPTPTEVGLPRRTLASRSRAAAAPRPRVAALSGCGPGSSAPRRPHGETGRSRPDGPISPEDGYEIEVAERARSRPSTDPGSSSASRSRRIDSRRGLPHLSRTVDADLLVPASSPQACRSSSSSRPGPTTGSRRGFNSAARARASQAREALRQARGDARNAPGRAARRLGWLGDGDD